MQRETEYKKITAKKCQSLLNTSADYHISINDNKVEVHHTQLPSPHHHHISQIRTAMEGNCNGETSCTAAHTTLPEAKTHSRNSYSSWDPKKLWGIREKYDWCGQL